MGVDLFTKKFGEGDHIFQKGKEKKISGRNVRFKSK